MEFTFGLVATAFVLSLLITTTVNAQLRPPSPKIEQLQQSLLAPNVHDTTRFTMLQKLSFLWSIHNLDTSLRYGMQAFALAERMHDTERMGRAALFIAGKYMHKGSYNEALASARRALVLFEQAKSPSRVADAHKSMGEILYLQGQHGEALRSKLQAFSYYKKAGERENQALIHKGIAEIYAASGSTAEAIRSYHDAAALFVQLQQPQFVCECYAELTVLYHTNKQLDSSQICLTKVLAMAQTLDNPHIATTVYKTLAAFFMRQGKAAEAIPYYTKLIELDAQWGGAGTVATLYAQRGEAYRADKKLPQAVQSFRDGITTATKVQARSELCACYRGLAQTFGDGRRFDSAYYYQNKFIALSDSLRSEESIKTIAEMQARFNVQQKEQEISLLQSKNQAQAAIAERQRVQRNALIVGVVALLALAVLLVNRYRLKKRSEATLQAKNKSLTEANDEIVQQQELLAEQSRNIQLANTRLQQTNLDLQHTNQALEESNNLRMKFLSIAAHDLKNPLTTMIGTATVFRANLLARSQPTELLDAMTNAAERMYALIAELLDNAAVQLGRIELRTEPVDISALCEELAQSYSTQAAAKQQHLEYSLDESCVVMGDAQRLRQVVENLLSNAVKFSPFDTPIRVRLRRGSDDVVFEVEDEGPGITEADQRKLFGFFQRLSARPTGGETSYGVGLSSAKQIVELHGGRITVLSVYGEGSTFTVTLPIKLYEKISTNFITHPTNITTPRGL